MGLRIQNNVEAFNAHRQLTATSSKAAKAMERLSSGFRVNRASDDAAGMAISEKMRSQIGGVAQAQRNAQDAVSMVQTAEGALTEVHSMLQRIRDLKVQSENGTLNTDDKASILKEVSALGDEIAEIVEKTEFNGIKLLAGRNVLVENLVADDTEPMVVTNAEATATTNVDRRTVNLQVGANSGETITVDVSHLNTDADDVQGTTETALHRVTSAVRLTDGVAADDLVGNGTTNPWGIDESKGFSLQDVDDAVKEVSNRRAALGATQNRLEHRLNNLSAYQENLVAAESRIRDVDMAQEMVNFSKLQILQQAGTAMLAQANQSSQGVLSLLQR